MDIIVEQPEWPINLRNFLSEYQNKLPSTLDLTDQSLPFYFASTSPVAADVEASCSLDNLSSSDDNTIHVFEPGVEVQRPNVEKPRMDNAMPKTYNAINLHKDSSRQNPFTRTQYSHRLIAPPASSKDEGSATKQRAEYELEITVRVYRQPRATHRGYKVERPVFAEEFVCLGSNYLSELRDKLSCVCNGKRFVDISNDPEAPLPSLETDPGYFFIQDTFYNDQRNPNNCDYSETVIQWAHTALGMQGEQFKVAPMESTRFIDLTVSLGTPLQYLHHGNCEHLFAFTQVVVLMPQTQCGNITQYPYMRAFNNYNRRTCYMCGLRSFYFIVEQSRRQLHDPSYLCRRCFYSFHYIDGKKVGQFRAYRIYDHSEELDDELSKQDGDAINDGSEDSDED